MNAEKVGGRCQLMPATVKKLSLSGCSLNHLDLNELKRVLDAIPETVELVDLSHNALDHIRGGTYKDVGVLLIATRKKIILNTNIFPDQRVSDYIEAREVERNGMRLYISHLAENSRFFSFTKGGKKRHPLGDQRVLDKIGEFAGYFPGPK